jgi:hypothetical protein
LGRPVQDWFCVSRLKTLPVSGRLSTQNVQIRDLLNMAINRQRCKPERYFPDGLLHLQDMGCNPDWGQKE